MHVLEYLWKAAWSFFDKGDPDAESLGRRAGRQDPRTARPPRSRPGSAAAPPPSATRPPSAKAPTPAPATSPPRNQYLDYATALAEGWPIATGVIEGACRHLVKDRMDITGARWGLDGAEAILKLRALISNGDFDQYWRYHLRQEHKRVHNARYRHSLHPRRVITSSLQKSRTHTILRFFERANAAVKWSSVYQPLFHELIIRHARWWELALRESSAPWAGRDALRELSEWGRTYEARWPELAYLASWQASRERDFDKNDQSISGG